MRDPPPSFSAMCGAFHQDAFVVAGDSLDGLAKHSIGCVPKDRRSELAVWLQGFLERRDRTELRRVLRKQTHVAIAMSPDNWWTLFTRIQDGLMAK